MGSLTPEGSELAWKLRDYEARGEEAPERIKHTPEACEGDLMSDDEVQQFIADGVQTCLVLRDKRSPRAGEVQAMFFNDLKFLVSIGRIDRDDYNEIIHPDNYHF